MRDIAIWGAEGYSDYNVFFIPLLLFAHLCVRVKEAEKDGSLQIHVHRIGCQSPKMSSLFFFFALPNLSFSLFLSLSLSNNEID